MCDVSRRGFLTGSAAFLSLAAEAELLAGPTPALTPEVGKIDLVAPDIYFHEGQVADNGGRSLQQRLDHIRRLRVGDRCQFPGRSKAGHRQDPFADGQADQVCPRHPPPRRPRLRKSGFRGKRRGARRPHRRHRGNEDGTKRATTTANRAPGKKRQWAAPM